ncbi:13561_t:CDS:2, partial [Cetraspora pellucida]
EYYCNSELESFLLMYNYILEYPPCNVPPRLHVECEISGYFKDDKPERLHQHVLRCSDWPASEKAVYLRKISEESSVTRKHVHEDEEVFTSTENRNTSQLPAPYHQSTIDWYSQPLPQTHLEKLHQNLLKAIIYGNLPFNIVENPYLKDYLRELNPSYYLPFRDMLQGRLLTKIFSDHLQKRLNTLLSLTDENQETVLDILNLSAHCHTSEFFKGKVTEVLFTNGIQILSTIAVVTNNASNMDRMQRMLHLLNWKEKQGISHFLSTFCETRWFSLAKVCIDILTYEQGFQHCLSLSETTGSRYPEIENMVIKNIIHDRYHFATNDTLTKVIKPIVNAIGELELNDSSLADAHALAVINKRAREFDSDVYFIALFLFLAHKQLAISKKINGDKLIRASLELAKAWKFTKRDSASCEWLFSSLGLVKSKIRNKITPDNLSIIGQLRNELQKKVSTKVNLCSSTTSEPLIDDNRNIDIFFDEENKQLEEVNEELEEVIVEQDEISFMEELFNFTMYEKDQDMLEEGLLQVNMEQNNSPPENDDWSVDDIFSENQINL